VENQEVRMTDREVLMMCYGALKVLSNKYSSEPLEVIKITEEYLWPPKIFVPAGADLLVSKN
jgi:hypothetical protein